jgi:hypothetical protein
MLSRIINLEGDCYLGIEAFGTLRREVLSRIEYQSINAGSHSDFFRYQIMDSAIRVGGAFSD